MVIANNTFTYTASTLTNYIIVKGGIGNTPFLNTAINLPVPPTTLNGMMITIRKYQNMGIVNINITGATNIIIPNGSVSETNLLSMSATVSTAQLLIMDGIYYQII